VIRLLIALVCAVPLMAAPPDLEEVACAWCHFEEADDFAESVHYQRGYILCNDCHGGLPYEDDEEIAKAPQTGFIGKPERGDVAEICAQCHAGPADFFAQGPHREWLNEDNPTCITCHSNHKVFDANLALMDVTCSECHDEWSAALDQGQKIKVELEVVAEHLQRVGRVVDSLVVVDRSVRKARLFVEDARGVLRGADAATHALDVGVIVGMVEEARGREGIAGAEGVVAGYYAELERRLWIVVGVWVFVVVNVGFLWWKRRDLGDGER